jgi:hypothetical protein
MWLTSTERWTTYRMSAGSKTSKRPATRALVVATFRRDFELFGYPLAET